MTKILLFYVAGLPSVVRTDHGTENSVVAYIQPFTAFTMKKNGLLNVWNTTVTPLDLSNGASSEKTPQMF